MIAGLLRNIVIAAILFAAYNEFVVMYRAHAFNDFTFHQSRQLIEDKLGAPYAVHNCKTGPHPALLPYAESFCKDLVEEIAAYKACYIEPRCPGHIYIVYDRGGRMLSKFNLKP